MGKVPGSNAFQPDGRYGLVTNTDDTFVSVLDRQSSAAVPRIEVGAPQTTVSFTPDGAMAFVSVGMHNEVVAIDMRSLAVAGRI